MTIGFGIDTVLVTAVFPEPFWTEGVDWDAVDREIREGHELKRIWEERAGGSRQVLPRSIRRSSGLSYRQDCSPLLRHGMARRTDGSPSNGTSPEVPEADGQSRPHRLG